MAFFDDVLDAIGRTPRELGAVHLFVESCVANWTPAALLLWLLWFPVGAVLLTMASRQRGQVRGVVAQSGVVPTT